MFDCFFSCHRSVKEYLARKKVNKGRKMSRNEIERFLSSADLSGIFSFEVLTRMKCHRRFFINETSKRATLETVPIKRLMILRCRARSFDKFWRWQNLKSFKIFREQKTIYQYFRAFQKLGHLEVDLMLTWCWLCDGLKIANHLKIDKKPSRRNVLNTFLQVFKKLKSFEMFENFFSKFKKFQVFEKIFKSFFKIFL